MAVWKQIQDATNFTTEKCKLLSRKVMKLVREQCYSVDRAIEVVVKEKQ